MRWLSRCLRTTHGGAVAAEETVGTEWLEKEEFEKVFWGLLEQKQAEKQKQNNKTGRKRSAAWTLFCTWL